MTLNLLRKRNSLFSVSHYIDNVGLSLLLTKSPKTPQKSCQVAGMCRCSTRSCIQFVVIPFQDTLPSSALVRIYIAPSSATVVTRSLRVTFSDQVSRYFGTKDPLRKKDSLPKDMYACCSLPMCA